MPHVCPWWSVPFTINPPLRRWLHDPRKIVGPHVQPGMTVLDVGCGFGYFSLPMAEMVGPRGKVIAVDLQQQMLDMLCCQAQRAGVLDRIELCKCERDRLGISATADFALVFAVLHEPPDPERMLREVYDCLRPGGRLLLAEPPLHVSRKKFAAESAAAEAVGFRLIARPSLRWCKAALLQK